MHGHWKELLGLLGQIEAHPERPFTEERKRVAPLPLAR